MTPAPGWNDLLPFHTLAQPEHAPGVHLPRSHSQAKKHALTAMSHPADFPDAHSRHWDDAELLLNHLRWANSDQAYGFSAECGLKAVMHSHGMQVDAHGKPRDKRHAQHVQKLWNTCLIFLNGRLAPRYLTLFPTGAPFADWSQHDRYAHSTHFTASTVAPHRTAARAIRHMVQQLAQDGVL